MLRIHLFGHFTLSEGKRPLNFSALPKTRPLFAYLLLNRQQPISREAIAFTLWPNVPEREAKANLRRHLYDLRRILPPNEQWIISRGSSLQWQPTADYWLDTARFEELSQTNQLIAAIALYQDNLLTDLYENWLEPERERLRALYLSNLEQLIDRYQTEADYPQAIYYAQQLLATEPLREDAIRCLMQLRFESGDRAGALRTYQQFERHIQAELGVAPMPETADLHAKIKYGPGNQPNSPSTTPAALPHNLPHQLTSFFGRTLDLITITERLTDRSTRLLTLTGLGGSGKTRLALEAAQCLLAQAPPIFREGIYFVDLSAITEPDQIVASINEILALKENPEQTATEQLKTYLQGKQILLILDNFEHLVSAAPILTDLLSTIPTLVLLVTSRILLQLYGEQAYSVPPLPLPEPNRLPSTADLLDYAAISLFIARARAYQPTFTLNDENGVAIAQICQRLDGLPLAIELAAARIKLFSPTPLLRQLTNRLSFLTSSTQDKPARQQTLRGAIDWSYHLLNAAEKQLFIHLAIFQGGFTVNAVTAILYNHPAPDFHTLDYAILDQLLSLVEKSMLQQSTSTINEPRFHLLPLLREYAQEHLQKDPHWPQLQQQHLHYYSQLTQMADDQLDSPQQSQWLARLKAEEANCWAALHWSLDQTHPDHIIETGVKMSIALNNDYLRLHGRISEAWRWTCQTLTFQKRLTPQSYLRLLNQAATTAQWHGQYNLAEQLLAKAVPLAHELNDLKLLQITLHTLGFAAGRQAQYAKAEPLLTEAVNLRRQINQNEMDESLARTLNNLAIVLKYLGNYERAASLLQECLVYHLAKGNQLGAAANMSNLGKLALEQGDLESAESYFHDSFNIRQQLDDQIGVLMVLSGLAELKRHQGHYQQSIHLYSTCDILHLTLGQPLTPENLRQHEESLAFLKQKVTTAEFDKAWQSGQNAALAESTH